MKIMVLGVLVGALILGAIFGLNYFGYVNSAFFAPRMEQVRNDTFHNSQAYNDGMVRDLENLRIEYMSADDAHKAALKAIIIHRFSVYPASRMPDDLRAFYKSLN